MMANKDPEMLRKFRGHTSRINSLDFSENGEQFISGSSDKHIMVWHCKASMRAYRLFGHDDAVTCVTFAPKKNVFASSSKDRTFRLWKPTIAGKPELGVFRGHFGGILCVKFSPDEMNILTASEDSTMKMWSADRRHFVCTLNEHTNWVRSANFSSDGRLVVSGSDDKSVKIWDLRSPHNSVRTFGGLAGQVEEVVFHPSGTCLAAAMGNTVKIWDSNTMKLLQLYNFPSDVKSITFNASGNFLLSGCNDGMLRVFHLTQGRLLYTLEGHDNGVFAVRFSRTGEKFCSGGQDCHVHLWKSNVIYDKID